jgi:hypothetical protein
MPADVDTPVEPSEVKPTEETSKPKVTPEESIRLKIRMVAANADTEEQALAQKIIAKARDGKKKRAIDMVNITPGVAAILFMETNVRNRDFVATHAAELQRRMTAGLWKDNNATIAFTNDGSLFDGQHRLAGAALAGYTLKNYIAVFGIEKDNIDSVDCAKTRDGASHAKLDGIQSAPVKQTMVKNFAAYMKKAGETSFALPSPAEVKAAIENDDHILERALNIGDESCRAFRTPVFKLPQAGSLAYICLKNGWPEPTIKEYLTEMQSGEVKNGDANPLFVAGTVIEKSRNARDRKEALRTVQEFGAAIYAMQQIVRGVTATKSTTIKAEIKGGVPKPVYTAPVAH